MKTLYIISGAVAYDIYAPEQEYFFTLDETKADEVLERLCALPPDPAIQTEVEAGGRFVREGEEDELDTRIVLHKSEVELDSMPWDLMSEQEREDFNRELVERFSGQRDQR